MKPSIESWREPPDWTAIEARWQLEPELRAPAPRRIVPRQGRMGCGARLLDGCLTAFVGLIFLLGLMMSLWAGLAVLIMPFGSVRDGTVTAHEVNYKGKSNAFFLHFRFERHGNRYTGKWPVNEKLYARLRDGDTTPVRYFAFAPGLRPALEQGISPWAHVWLLGPLGLLMLCVSGVSLLAFVGPKKGKRLVRWGQPVPGMVTERALNQGVRGAEGTRLFHSALSHHIIVIYRVGPQTFEQRFSLTYDNAAALVPGQTLTMLVLPRRPERAYPYRFCEFKPEPTTLNP